MAFSAASFWMIFINTTALPAAMWDTKSNIEKMEKNEKSCWGSAADCLRSGSSPDLPEEGLFL